jgi:hypothetical protein
VRCAAVEKSRSFGSLRALSAADSRLREQAIGRAAARPIAKNFGLGFPTADPVLPSEFSRDRT